VHFPTVEPAVPVPQEPLPHCALEWHEVPGAQVMTQAPPLQSAALLQMHLALTREQVWPAPQTDAAVLAVQMVWLQVPREPLQEKVVLGQSALDAHGSLH
jgi:hypothetical protein